VSRQRCEKRKNTFDREMTFINRLKCAPRSLARFGEAAGLPRRAGRRPPCQGSRLRWTKTTICVLLCLIHQLLYTHNSSVNCKDQKMKKKTKKQDCKWFVLLFFFWFLSITVNKRGSIPCRISAVKHEKKYLSQRPNIYLPHRREIVSGAVFEEKAHFRILEILQ